MALPSEIETESPLMFSIRNEDYKRAITCLNKALFPMVAYSVDQLSMAHETISAMKDNINSAIRFLDRE